MVAWAEFRILDQNSRIMSPAHAGEWAQRFARTGEYISCVGLQHRPSTRNNNHAIWLEANGASGAIREHFAANEFNRRVRRMISGRNLVQSVRNPQQNFEENRVGKSLDSGVLVLSHRYIKHNGGGTCF